MKADEIKRHLICGGVLGLLMSVSAAAQTAPPQPVQCPAPPHVFPQMTYDEDTRYLRDPACRTNTLDGLKYIPLSEDNDDHYLSFGAPVRERGEYFNNPNWGAGPRGSAYLLQRYYVHADAHLGARVRAFGELGSSLERGRTGGRRPNIDEDRLDLHQAFIDIRVWQAGKNSLTLRTGRHEMAFGNNSLISTRDGRNVRRSFDGLRMTGKWNEWTANVLAVKPALSKPGSFDDGIDPSSNLWGVYAVGPLPGLRDGHIDLYYLGLGNRSVKFDQGTDREQRETVGTRLSGRTDRWDYSQEYTFQWGSFGSADIRAWAVSTETGYRLDSVRLRPRIAAKADAFSGDRDRANPKLGTFNALYEKGPDFSYAELIGKRNLMALQPYIALALPGSITATPNTAFFWRNSTEDGLYAAGSGVLEVSGQRSQARYIGSHASMQVKWSANRHTTLFAEYLHFFPGAFVQQSTPGRSINYATWWLELRF
jgi:alginate export protein